MDCHRKVLGRWQKESNENRSEGRTRELSAKEIGTTGTATRAKAATRGTGTPPRADSELIMDD